jgi:hypothetical protein
LASQAARSRPGASATVAVAAGADVKRAEREREWVEEEQEARAVESMSDERFPSASEVLPNRIGGPVFQSREDSAADSKNIPLEAKDRAQKRRVERNAQAAQALASRAAEGTKKLVTKSSAAATASEHRLRATASSGDKGVAGCSEDSGGGGGVASYSVGSGGGGGGGVTGCLVGSGGGGGEWSGPFRDGDGRSNSHGGLGAADAEGLGASAGHNS